MVRVVRWLAAVTTAGMFLVLVMGAAVTNTDSAAGCGRSWPLCNGRFVPEFTVATAIEYSHRAVTGLEGVLVVALTASMLRLFGRRAGALDRQVVVLALVMLVTLLLQAGLGAGAVLAPQAALMLATHFGVSLVAFASTFLSAVVVFERTARRPPRRTLATSRFRAWTLGVGVYTLVVVYLGAYVRHAGVSLACADWPLCNGRLVPVLDGATGVVFAHRVAALGMLLALLLLASEARRAGIGWRSSQVAVGLGIVQALSGALVVWTRLGLFSTLAHAAIMALLFATLAGLVRLALQTAAAPIGVPAGRATAAPGGPHRQPPPAAAQPPGWSSPHSRAG